MDRQQISWLAVRAFGLYLLIQAIMLVPDLLAGLYATRAYSNLISSMGSDNNNLASTARAAGVRARMKDEVRRSRCIGIDSPVEILRLISPGQFSPDRFL